MKMFQRAMIMIGVFAVVILISSQMALAQTVAAPGFGSLCGFSCLIMLIVLAIFIYLIYWLYQKSKGGA